MGKIVTKLQFEQEIRDGIKKDNKIIVLCHGVFDLVHPGHIIHFEQAKKMGDILVVSVTSAQFVRKGPDRPYFDDEMRMKFLEAIDYIDYVILSEGYTVDDIIKSVRPDFYVKGEEYKNAQNDITGKIAEEQRLVEKYGGQIKFTEGQVFSSTKLINTAMSGIPEDVRLYMENFKNRYTIEDIKKYADKICELKVLVLGDVIIDKYVYCNVQGIMSKDMGYSARLQGMEEYYGGAVAVARHLATFTSSLTLMSIIGEEKNIQDSMFEELSDKMDLELVFSKKIPTIVKQRYLMRNEKRDEYIKLFAINNIPEKVTYENSVREDFLNKLRESIDKYDVVLLCDFGHGIVDEAVMEIVQKRAKFLAVNCQTNSSNTGMNIITKYKRADVFSLDQNELNLAYPSYTDSEEKKLKKLSAHLGGRGWLTRGALGAWQIEQDTIGECPAFTLKVKDTVGAGDAFYSLATIFSAVGAPMEIGTFMGNIGGALGANIVGNKESVEKVNALKFASTLMNI